MSSYARKLILAALVSLLGATASYTWYKLSNRVKETSTSKVLAHLESKTDEVQKRQVKKFIWQSIDEGEELHSGEAVRTSEESEAKIVFDSGAEVDLDPDSVIVIEDTGNKVDLDFLKGNLLVKGNQGGSELALKSGDTSIAVKDSEMTLGKGKGQNVNVQVLRGVAEVSAGSKKLTLDNTKQGTIGAGGMDVSQKFFVNLAPAMDEKVYIRAGQTVPFKWQGVTDDYLVHLEMGASRTAMSQVGTAVPGSKGVIMAPLKPGAVYWRLVAVSKKNSKESHASFANKAVVLIDAPPRLLSPTPDQTVVLTSKAQGVELRWSNPSHLSKLQLEIARDRQFKDVVLNKFVDDTGVYTFSDDKGVFSSIKKGQGGFYWRVAGYRTAKATPLVSEPGTFKLQTQFELHSPEMKFPASGAHVAFESVNSGSSYFAWQPLQGVSRYHIRVEAVKTPAPKTPIFEKDIFDVSQVKMPALSPGKYRWSVTSIDEDGKESKVPEPHEFLVDQVPTLPWVTNEQQENYYYVTDKPSLKPDWQLKTKEHYEHFRVTVKSDAGFDKAVETDGKEPVVDLPADGLFHVTVEALNAKGQTVARSTSKDFFVSAKPLLPAPVFGDRLPASLQAQNNGSVQVNWKPVSGAKEYALQVKDKNGTVVKTERFSVLSGKIKDLLPGEYKVSISSVDQFGRVGPVGEEKGLVVPDVSDAKPPALKKLQIR